MRDLSPTKRNVISVIGRFYDPLGFLSPITIRFKVFMQELYRLKLSWDEELSGIPRSKWNDLVDVTPQGPDNPKVGIALGTPACVTNVADNLKCRFPLREPNCFTDSQVAPFWITGIKREWKLFAE